MFFLTAEGQDSRQSSKPYRVPVNDFGSLALTERARES
jgi:hypothetical protein